MELDYESFIAGVQVGRRLKMWDAGRKVPSIIENARIITEDGDPITTEDGNYIVTEQYFSEVNS